MKIEQFYFPALDEEVQFVIGQNQQENFGVIELGKETDWWFHANDAPSCHVVAILPESIQVPDKKLLKQIIKKGALLCKQHTRSLKSLSQVEIVYTQIKQLEKTSVPGTVHIKGGAKHVCV